jgi:hypothetical protein
VKLASLLYYADTVKSIVTNIAEQFEGLKNGYLGSARDTMGMIFCAVAPFSIVLTVNTVQMEQAWAEEGVKRHAGFQKTMKPATHRCLMKKQGISVLTKPYMICTAADRTIQVLPYLIRVKNSTSTSSSTRNHRRSS